VKRVAVYCGSSEGHDPRYAELGSKFGELLAQNRLELVYGGASIGVMASIANATLKGKGEVWGIIPESIANLELAHDGVTHLEVVSSMHVRKKRMYDLADAFVAFPGGMGTLDELCEIITWAQLQFHKKPIFIMNCYGYYDSFIEHLKRMVDEGFMSEEHLKLIEVVTEPEEIINGCLSI
jgi:uncharacterized protein (TIGR00730 family)